jgi:transcriptional regulator with XRE-family HTH domain
MLQTVLACVVDTAAAADAVLDWRMRYGLSQLAAAERTGIYCAFFTRIENQHYENVCKSIRDKLYEETGVFIKGEIAKKPKSMFGNEIHGRPTAGPSPVVIQHRVNL